MTLRAHQHWNNYIKLLTVLLLTVCDVQAKKSSIAVEQPRNTDPLNLHVPSPDWRDQIIYFLMIDRFNDGDATNNDQGKGEYDPAKGSHFSGGDLKGISNQLDYIQKLGATSIWITPPVANQWWSKSKQFGGFHGYWAVDFKNIDNHFGTIEDYQQLSHQLHQRGMYLIQDIVTNHTGNFFGYIGEYDSEDTSKNFKISEDVNSFQWKPDQYPFNLIDRNNSKHVTADIYHWTPPISNYNNPEEESNFQLSGLADLNTSNETVRDALKDSYRFWINQVGVDAFRIDTVKFVEHDFWNDFLHSKDGILEAAKQTGRKNFLAFGEIFEISAELNDAGEKKIASYYGSSDVPELNSVIGFPLFGELGRVFALGRPTANLAYRLRKHMQIYKNPYVIPNFVDNHDTQRFLADGSLDALKQALFTIFTIPGIPVVYQGTEQALEETREAMFAGGYHSTRDKFDSESEMFRFIQTLSELRKTNKTLTRGSLQIIQEDKSASGVLAYKRTYKGEQLLVILNSADREKLVSNMETGFRTTTVFTAEFNQNIDVSEKNLFVSDNHGNLTMVLPPRTMLILAAEKTHTQNQPITSENIEITVNQVLGSKPLIQPTQISGTINKANAKLQIVINGELTKAKSFVADSTGYWKVELPVTGFGYQENRFSIFSKENGVASVEQKYYTNQKKSELTLEFIDPKNDDNGPKGNYRNPQHDHSKKQMDIEKAVVKVAGDILEITLSMAQISTVWGPINGFDNVSFSLFFSIPGNKGKTNLPNLNSAFPEKLEWSFGHVFYGWGNSVFSHEGATQTTATKKIAASPEIVVDKEQGTIRITYKGLLLGVDDWHDSSVYISTWDKTGEGEYRALSQEGGLWEFSGGDNESPRVMDDLLIKIVPKNNKFFKREKK